MNFYDTKTIYYVLIYLLQDKRGAEELVGSLEISSGAACLDYSKSDFSKSSMILWNIVQSESKRSTTNFMDFFGLVADENTKLKIFTRFNQVFSFRCHFWFYSFKLHIFKRIRAFNFSTCQRNRFSINSCTVVNLTHPQSKWCLLARNKNNCNKYNNDGKVIPALWPLANEQFGMQFELLFETRFVKFNIIWLKVFHQWIWYGFT